MKLSVLIPVYNEQLTIDEVLRRVQEVDLEKDIVVVNDGSTDGTAELLKRHVDANMQVVHLPTNAGKGLAIREGLRYVRGDVVVIQDADLELNPNEYHAMLEPIMSGETRVVYGSRFAAAAPGIRWSTRLANMVLTKLTNLLYHGNLTDMETAYKMFRREAVAGIRLTCRRFEFEPEVTAKLLKLGERIVEVPVAYSPRNRDEGKKIGWRDGLTALLTVVRYRFQD